MIQSLKSLSDLVYMHVYIYIHRAIWDICNTYIHGCYINPGYVITAATLNIFSMLSSYIIVKWNANDLFCLILHMVIMILILWPQSHIMMESNQMMVHSGVNEN